jgi:hypothetical protein
MPSSSNSPLVMTSLTEARKNAAARAVLIFDLLNQSYPLAASSYPSSNLQTPRDRISEPAAHDHFSGGKPKCAACEAYAATSSNIASMVAANGATLTNPENTARSPMLSSMRNVGRCVT